MADLDEVVKKQQGLTPEDRSRIEFWDGGAITSRWIHLLLQWIKGNNLNPVRAARAIALVTVAMNDTTVACWDAKSIYNVPAPARRNPAIKPLAYALDVSSYPSEHAAVAAAAVSVLSYLFPAGADEFNATARQLGDLRVAAGVNTRSDVNAGNALGKAVGALVVERGRTDSSDAPYLGDIPVGAGLWVAIWPRNLLEPMAGYWRPWVLSSGAEFTPPPPPVFGSDQYFAELDEINHALANITEEQKAIVLFWADGHGSITPAGHWIRDASTLVDERYPHDAPRATRALALVGMALADAAISCWHTKFTYWTERPYQVMDEPEIRKHYATLQIPLNIKPPERPKPVSPFLTYITTPPFPGYTSGHATFSAAASEVLAYLFPDRADQLRAAAEQAALSRLLAGIHISSDNLQGLAVGRKIGRRVVEFACGSEGL